MVWDLDLPHPQLIVLLALTDHADHEGGNIWPSAARIAWKTGYSDRSVRRIIDDLVDLKVLEVDEERPGRTTVYRVNFDNAPKKKPFILQKRGPKPQDTPDKASPLTDQSPDAITPDTGLITPDKESITPDTQMSDEPENRPEKNRHSSGAKAPAHAGRKDFIALWFDSYEAHFERKYRFDKRRDGQAVNDLLAMGLEWPSILKIAIRAWSEMGDDRKHFHCKQAVTFHGLYRNWNQITLELDPPRNKGSTPTAEEYNKAFQGPK